MAKLIPDAILDSQLDVIGAADRLFICATQPTTYAQASTTYNLGTKTLTGAFSKAAGDTSGRKLILAAQSSIAVTADGVVAHYALGVNGSSTLLLVGTVSPTQQTYNGNTINFPQTDVAEARALA